MDALFGQTPCERAPSPAPWAAGARTPSPPIAIPGAEQGVWRAPRAQRISGESAPGRANSSDALYEMEQ